MTLDAENDAEAQDLTTTLAALLTLEHGHKQEQEQAGEEDVEPAVETFIDLDKHFHELTQKSTNKYIKALRLFQIEIAIRLSENFKGPIPPPGKENDVSRTRLPRLL